MVVWLVGNGSSSGHGKNDLGSRCVFNGANSPNGESCKAACDSKSGMKRAMGDDGQSNSPVTVCKALDDRSSEVRRGTGENSLSELLSGLDADRLRYCSGRDGTGGSGSFGLSELDIRGRLSFVVDIDDRILSSAGLRLRTPPFRDDTLTDLTLTFDGATTRSRPSITFDLLGGLGKHKSKASSTLSS